MDRLLTIEQQKNLLDTIAREIAQADLTYPRLSLKWFRDGAIVILVLYTGLSIEDVVGLRLGDVELDKGIITLPDGNQVVLGDQPRQALQNYLDVRPEIVETDSLFIGQSNEGVQHRSVQRAVKRFSGSAGMDWLTISTLRYTWAYNELAKNPPAYSNTHTQKLGDPLQQFHEIQFCTAWGSQIGYYYEDTFPGKTVFPAAIRAEILQTIDALDQVFPGIRYIMEVSGLRIVYDPENRHDIFRLGQRRRRTAYYWPLHALYLGKSGIKSGIAYGIAHVLDMLAGPTMVDHQIKFGLPSINYYSIYHFWPQGGKFGNNLTEPEFAVTDPDSLNASSFVLTIICGMRFARRSADDRQRILEELTDASVVDAEMNHNLIAEGVAHIFEEYIYTWQADRRIPVRGVGGKGFFYNSERKHIMWGSRWIREREVHIRNYFQTMIDTILAMQRADKLDAKIAEMRSRFIQSPNVGQIMDELIGEF